MLAERSRSASISGEPRLDQPQGPLSSTQREGAAQVSEMQRSRLLVAAASTASEYGYDGASVARITERARISRRTFYELFDNREECLLAVLEGAVDQMRVEMDAANLDGLPWRERMRGGLWVILSFFDREPALARLCVIESQRAGQAMLERRQTIIDRLAELVDEGRLTSARGRPPVALTGSGIVGGVISIIYARLLGPQPGPLRELLGELMAMVVLPYTGSQIAHREQERPLPISPGAVGEGSIAPVSFDQLAQLPMRLTYRTAIVLQDIGEHPGSSNRQIAERVEIQDQGQASKLLSRLHRLGLLSNMSADASAKGEANKWCLTSTGAKITEAIRARASEEVQSKTPDAFTSPSHVGKTRPDRHIEDKSQMERCR